MSKILNKDKKVLAEKNSFHISQVKTNVDSLIATHTAIPTAHQDAPILTLPAWPVGAGTAMTRDGAYHDVDISGTYGASTHLVFLYIITLDSAVGQKVFLRPNGSADTVTYLVHQVNGTVSGYFAFVHTDSSGIFEYKAEAGLTTATYKILAVITP